MSSLFDVAVLAASAATDLDETLQLADLFHARDIVRFAIWLADNVGVENPEPPPTSPSTPINRAHLRTNRRIDLETMVILADLENSRERLTYLRLLAARQHHRIDRRIRSTRNSAVA